MIPDQVVLGSGGVLGDTWMSGVIAGLLESGGPDLRDSQRFVGTSAGSIVATRLASGRDMREHLSRRFERGFDAAKIERMAGAKGRVAPGDRASTLTRLASSLLRGSEPGGRLLRRSVLRVVPRGSRDLLGLGRSIDRMMPSWDPRLSLIGLSLERGSRVVMDAGNGLGLTVSEAVRASCAIPGVFRPIPTSQGSVVDGGVWSPVNLDAVRPPSGSTVLCLYPSGYLNRPRTLRDTVVTGISRSRVALESAALRAGGAEVMIVAPDPSAAEAIGPNRMDDERDPGVAVAGFRQGIELAPELAGWLSARDSAE